jgi:crotonobetainyl-CoA:carnitine CoA-transferase CaiB-like acyl-CoA transferase
LTEVLKGVRVVELGTMITAPLAGMMLADLGADVIKVERPDGGDPFRSFRGGLYSPHFIAFNRNKRSVALDLQTEAGKASLRALLAKADVLLDNYRSGVMDRLGLSAKFIQTEYPKLIWCSITGFGADGPYAGRAAYDAVAGALSGLASVTLDPDNPQASGPTIADNVTGMYAACGILGALYERETTGRGRRIEVNMLEAAVSFVPDAFSNFTRMQIDNQPRTRVASSQSYAFRCADDKLLALHLSSPQKFWESLLDVIERPDLKTDVRFATRDARVRNYAILEKELATVIGSKDRLHWMTKLDRADVPFAPVQTISEVLDDPQIKHLGTFHQQTHPTEGPLTLLRRPILIDGNRDIQSRPPPTLGEHTGEILQELSAMKSNPAPQKS